VPDRDLGHVEDGRDLRLLGVEQDDRAVRYPALPAPRVKEEEAA
jgi:hypothetical protein